MNLKDLLVNATRFFPDATSIIDRDYTLTYSELYQKTCDCASAMKNAGVAKNDYVCIACRNCAEYLQLMFACSMVGAIPSLINWRISPAAMAGMIHETHAKLLFLSSTEESTIDYFRKWEEAGDLQIVVIDEGHGTDSDYERFCRTGSGIPEFADTEDKETGLILFTSGTTGRAKGVMLSNKALMTQVFNSSIAGRWAPGERFLCVSPICHSISLSVMTTFCVSGTLILCPPDYLKEPGKIFELFDKHSVTRTALVPTVIERLVSYGEENNIHNERLKVIGYGASPMNTKLIERCKTVFSCSFHQGYGMTECYGSVTALIPEDHYKPELLRSVGRPMMGCSIRVLDDNGVEVPRGSVGEIVIKTDTAMNGYLGRPELTEKVLIDGWYHSGDIGYMNEQDYVFLTDRKSDMIITGGENVFPAEVEGCILGMSEGVRAVSVAGIQDSVWGEIIVAAVVKRAGSDITEEQIMNYCRRHLGSFKKPKKIMFVDALPVTDSNKVSRVKVRELFKQENK